jgi:phage tail-like protein
MIVGTPRTFHKKFLFVVEVDGFSSASFQKASELSIEAAKVEHWEGGSIIPNKSPGRLTFADVTLERGATQDEDLYKWFLDVANAASGLGLVDPFFKREADLVQKDRDGATLRRWTLHGCWPTKFVAGAWDNTADENVIESVTLAYDYFEPGR